MKRVIVISDSHGSVSDLRDAVREALMHGEIDALIFLGDGLDDLKQIAPMLRANRASTRIVAVRGNNDWRSAAGASEEITIDGARIFACHGHEWGVKYGMERLCFAAREREVQVALFGHTHHSFLAYEYGIWFVNPGAVCDRRRGAVAYAELLIDDGRVRAELRDWE